MTTLKDLARAGLAKLERNHPELARAAEEPTRGQPLRDLHFTAVESEALHALTHALASSPSVVVGRALLALAEARGIQPRGGR
ncbi:hypothetical protein ACLESD_13005 [Pyxidicoccus sp. 3LFB2]